MGGGGRTPADCVGELKCILLILFYPAINMNLAKRNFFKIIISLEIISPRKSFFFFNDGSILKV